MNRQMRRRKHRLIEVPHAKLQMQIITTNAQRKYTCSCGSGWLTIATTKPLGAFEQHVKQMKGAV